jgi:hypothetical protein
MSYRYTAHFQPEVWMNDNALPVDPQGETEWDVTEYVVGTMSYWEAQMTDEPDDEWHWGVLDTDDVLMHTPAAPEPPTWVANWSGPFTIRVTREPVS